MQHLVSQTGVQVVAHAAGAPHVGAHEEAQLCFANNPLSKPPPHDFVQQVLAGAHDAAGAAHAGAQLAGAAQAGAQAGAQATAGAAQAGAQAGAQVAAGAAQVAAGAQAGAQVAAGAAQAGAQAGAQAAAGAAQAGAQPLPVLQQAPPAEEEVQQPVGQQESQHGGLMSEQRR